MAHSTHVVNRGVVVRERDGTPFRQIFWSRNGAPATIVGHRWNANTDAFPQITSYHGVKTSVCTVVVLVRLTLDQFIFWPKLPPNVGFGIKNYKKIPGYTGWPEKSVSNFRMALCNRVGEMNQQKNMYVMSKHLRICL